MFDSVIIDNEMTTADLPAVQQSSLYNKINERNETFMQKIRSNVIDAALRDMGQHSIENCNIPTKEQLMNATKQDPISWDPVANFTRNESQVRESFEEQRSAVSFCTKAINKYLEFGNKFVKCTAYEVMLVVGRHGQCYMLCYMLCHKV